MLRQARRPYIEPLALDHISRPSPASRRWPIYASVILLALLVGSLARIAISGSTSPEPRSAAAVGAAQPFGRYLTQTEFDTAARRAGWNWAQLPAIRSLVACETNGTFDTLAYNGDDPNGGSYGLAQLNGEQHFEAAHEDFAQRFDPVTNLRVALWLYRDRGGFGGTGGWLICAQRLGLGG